MRISHTENVGAIVGVMVGYLVGDIVGCNSSNQTQVVRERRVSIQINGYIIACATHRKGWIQCGRYCRGCSGKKCRLLRREVTLMVSTKM